MIERASEAGGDGHRAVEGGAEGTETVLLGSSRQWLATAFTTVLEGDGFRVRRARDSGEILEAAGEARPGAVIVDSELPSGGVPDLCRRLSELPGDGALPVLVYSPELPDEEWHAEVIEAGAWQLLREPIRARPLLSTLRRVLRISRGFGVSGDRVSLEAGQELEVSGVMTVRPS